MRLRTNAIFILIIFACVSFSSCNEDYPGPPCDGLQYYYYLSSGFSSSVPYKKGQLINAIQEKDGRKESIQFLIGEDVFKIVETDSTGICNSVKREARYIAMISRSNSLTSDTLVFRYMASNRIGFWYKDRGVFFEKPYAITDTVWQFQKVYGQDDTVLVKYSNWDSLLEYRSTHYKLKWSLL